ncbi:hypothetical protein LZ575_01230 [Antarcticibacterium sp. 1MA-6-2]|uniref:hypothetical protein n=1 Tax=Antarcticibacterium sp. 1MA-6-2 TaxID=2908210 RepID=UPI001F2293A7|nr:hypothetical protein [Antarcticibacterium sp. 1MA-6-2]UJH91438.1 hypothetical protein LZ575_01230 [Antarcticibacterium sp. 1MA-6-2]
MPEDADYFEQTLVIKPTDPEGANFKRLVGKNLDAPLVYKTKYFSKDGTTVDMPEKNITQLKMGQQPLL